MPYEKYLDFGIENLQDILTAYQEYSNGGFWVKKIDKKDAFYREIIEGPYKKNKAEEIAKEWNAFYKYKNFITAQVHSLTDLLCKDTKQKGLEKHFYGEHIWDPPAGSDLFCILKKFKLTSVHKKDIMENKEFKKFWDFTSCSGVSKLEVNDLLVFYFVKNAESYKQAKILQMIIKQFEDKPEEMQWMIDYVEKKKEKRGIKPVVIPNFINKSESCMPIDLEFFKEVYTSKKGIVYAFDKLNKCMNDQEKSISGEVDSLSTTLNIDFLLNSKDYKIKKLYFTRRAKNNYTLKFNDMAENFYIRLVDIKDREGYMEIRMPKDKEEWLEYINNTMGNDRKFANFDSTMGLFLFIAKCLGIHKIKLKDDRQMPCTCYDTKEEIYINIIYDLAKRENLYEKFGFFNNDNEDFFEEYRGKIVRLFLGRRAKLPKEEDDFFLDRSLEKISQLYLEGYCKYGTTCELIKEISDRLYEELGEENLIYTLNLKKYNIEFYRKMF